MRVKLEAYQDVLQKLQDTLTQLDRAKSEVERLSELNKEWNGIAKELHYKTLKENTQLKAQNKELVDALEVISDYDKENAVNYLHSNKCFIGKDNYNDFEIFELVAKQALKSKEVN